MSQGYGGPVPPVLARNPRPGGALSGKKILVAAHGNGIRAMVKYLDNISDDEIVGLNIPTGIPLVYELDANLKAHPSPVPRRSPTKSPAPMAAVASQGKAKTAG